MYQLQHSNSLVLFLVVLCSGRTILTAAEDSFGVDNYANDMSCEWLISLRVEGVSIPRTLTYAVDMFINRLLIFSPETANENEFKIKTL